MTKDLLIELVGWLGVSSYVLAYLLLAVDVFNAESILFHTMYLLGAAGIIYHSYYKKDFQPIIVNVFFGTIALFALIKLGVL